VVGLLEEGAHPNWADSNLAVGPALVQAVRRWVNDELRDKGCTSDRIKELPVAVRVLPGGDALSLLREFDWRVWWNLWGIRNPKVIPHLVGILSTLIHNEGTGQHAWTSIMDHSGDEDERREMPLSVMEILCLCAERGAQPTDKELQNILERAHGGRRGELTLPGEITRNEELTVAFLKTLLALHRNKPFTCDLHFLADCYEVSPEMLQLGRQLVCAVYGTMKQCLGSKNIIDCFLYMSQEQKTVLEERFIEDAFEANWLCRNSLHLAVMFLYSKESLNCLPISIVKKYLNAKDLHGCTPLHVAHMHHNQQAVAFLISHGAQENVTDNFGMRPESFASSHTAEDDYKKLCHRVLGVKCGVFKEIKCMLVHSEQKTNALSKEVKTLLEHLMRGTPFENADIVMGGSMREELKAGRLDEADIQLRFEGAEVIKDKPGEEKEFSIAGVKWYQKDFLFELSACLIGRLAEVSWEGIDLRPISVHGPWKLLREGVTVSLDVVPVIVYEGEMRHRGYRYITQKELHGLQGELLGGERPMHRPMEYCTLETWSDKGDEPFKPTYFAYEWDMIDSLPASCRLAIVTAKALVQAYDLCRGDSARVKMPVTSYMVKTGLFYILSHKSSQLHFRESGADERTRAKALRNALGHVAGNKSGVKARASKVQYNPQPKWLTDEHLRLHGEEARDLAWRIFTLIRYLAQQRDEYAPQGWKLSSYWDRRDPVVAIGGEYNESYGESEFICDICDCALERLNPTTFHDNE